MTMLCIADIVSPQIVKSINQSIAQHANHFESGAKSAGWQARKVKNNAQLPAQFARPILEKVESALLAHPIFKMAAQPKNIIRSLISRYEPGMEYGLHVDDALMGGTRTDLSFTLFLSPQDSYDGGALLVEGHDGTNEIKLEAGSLVIYPTTSLHRVEAVSKGERLAIVGWVRSFIRNTDAREALFDLDRVIAEMAAAKSDQNQLNTLLKVRANLIRLWAED